MGRIGSWPLPSHEILWSSGLAPPTFLATGSQVATDSLAADWRLMSWMSGIGTRLADHLGTRRLPVGMEDTLHVPFRRVTGDKKVG